MKYFCLIFGLLFGVVSVNGVRVPVCRAEYPLLVTTSSSPIYGSEGVFGCAEGYELFSSLNSTTRCLDGGKWNNTDMFKCYKAPEDIQICGDLTVKENDNMEINCTFPQTTPKTCETKFSIGGMMFDLPVGEPYIEPVTWEDHGMEIWCQPLNEYTETPQFSDRGKSVPRYINVLFSPRLSNQTHDACNWTIGDINTCNFTFFSNPMADVVHLYKVNNATALNGTDSSLTPVEFTYSSTSQDDVQTITITGVEMDEPGRFQLNIMSTVFPDVKVEHEFDLNVTEVPVDKHDRFLVVLLGIAVFIISALILVMVLIKKYYDNIHRASPCARNRV